MFEKEINALADAEPAISLVNQLIEWRRPGEYRFKDDFLEEYKVWVCASNMLRKSKDRDFRSFGNHMRELSQVMAELDELPKDSRKFRRKLAEVERIGTRGFRIGRRVSERLALINVV